MPKTIVDELELLAGGTIGPNGNYFAESYLVDGGQRGNLREAWLGEFIGAPSARVPLYARAGQFTLSLPVDPESFRETAEHYAVFDQTIGANPFNFFDPKLGVSLRAGNGGRGTSLEVAALNGHDQQSGLPTLGVDTMTTLKHVMGPFELSLYRYAGKRDVTDGDTGIGYVFDPDRFTRTGAGVRYEYGRWTSETVLQENTDTNADGLGTGFHSSGGFTQLRYAINARLFGLARYDGTNDNNGFSRSFTALLGLRTSANSRISIEDVITHVPLAQHTLNAQFTIAY